jgi:hypothetical protein
MPDSYPCRLAPTWHQLGAFPTSSSKGSAVFFTQPSDFIGSVCWARTSDPLINSQLLYQLS